MKRYALAAARNRDPILAVLQGELPKKGVVLEIASGSGEHALHFAAALPALIFQPSDPDPEAVASIEAHRAGSGLKNLRSPLTIDVLDAAWELGLEADAILCINMIHIAPWEATIGLFEGAARLLKRNRPLYLYGPYRFDGAFLAPSNQAFDASLRERDPLWGVRDYRELLDVAMSAGFNPARTVEMPANNHSHIFRRSGSPR
ncbi:MAG: DUF938 domain-containing protein, partial [Minicystis sp.]